MAGKSVLLHRLSHDVMPFAFSEDNSSVEYVGKLFMKGPLDHLDTWLKSLDFYNNYYGETLSR